MSRIAEAFARYFATWEISLPDSNLTNRERGDIRNIQFLFDRNRRGEYLELYATHRMTSDRHHRIYEDGTIEDLEACVDMVLYPIDATEEQQREATQRVRDHNAKVLSDLDRKGFA